MERLKEDVHRSVTPKSSIANASTNSSEQWDSKQLKSSKTKTLQQKNLLCV